MKGDETWMYFYDLFVTRMTNMVVGKRCQIVYGSGTVRLVKYCSYNKGIEAWVPVSEHIRAQLFKASLA